MFFPLKFIQGRLSDNSNRIQETGGKEENIKPFKRKQLITRAHSRWGAIANPNA